jgi:thioredoxin-related protein
LKKEVFSQAEFESYASKNLTLLEVDFPRSKFQTPERKAKNQALAQHYGIQGYPTLILMDNKGKKIGELGYMPGGPKPFIDKVKGMLPAKSGNGVSGKPYY